MLRASFLRRLYLGYVALILFTVVAVGITMTRQIEESSLREVRRSLETAAVVLREWAQPALLHARQGDAAELDLLRQRIIRLTAPNETRLTVILPDGTVLADSHEDPRVMENHADRPELIQAGAEGYGSSTRVSPTLGVPMMYVALRVEGRPVADEDARVLGFVRSALPLDTIDARLQALRESILGSAVASSIFALVLGFVLARRFTRPLREIIGSIRAISRGELDRTIPVRGRDEFGTLARAFNAMRERIREHHDTILSDRNKILAILAAMTEGVIAVDEREEVVHLNDAAGEMFGLDPSDAIGRALPSVIQLPELLRAIEATLRGEEGRHGEIELQRGMARVKMQLQTSGLRNRDGRTVGAVVVLHDVTEIRRLEEVRTDFISNVSHELKTPLAAIKGLVESILEDEEMPDDTRRRFLGRVQRQANRLNSLVIDLLSLSRLEREQDAMFEDESLDLRRAVLDGIEAQRPHAESKGLRVEVDVQDGPVRVVADHEAIRQIVDNLLSNAIRYTPAGGAVMVRLRGDGEEATLEIEDTGVGIDPVHHERIFERFYRVDKARSRELGGTGLGLAIVKHVVRRLGGSIGLDSEVGKGSHFTIQLPQASGAEADAPTAEPGVGTEDGPADLSPSPGAGRTD